MCIKRKLHVVSEKIHYIESSVVSEETKKEISDEIFDGIFKVLETNERFVAMHKKRQINIVKLQEFQSVLITHLEKVDKILEYLKKELI